MLISESQCIGQAIVRNRNWVDSLLTCTDEQSISQPRLEETVFRRFVDVHVTAEQQFHITWIHQEDDQLRTDPDFDDLVEVLSFLDNVAEDGWK